MRPPVSEVRDGMRIEWDVPIAMDDGVVLRADVFRPLDDGALSGDPHLRSVRQRACLPGRLPERMAAHGRETSRRRCRLDQQVSELGSRRSGKMGARRLRMRARRFARRRPLARLHRSFLAARDEGLLRVHRVGRRAAVVERQGRPERHLLLRHQPVARRVAAAAASRGDVHLGRRGRLVSRHDAPRRHPLHVLGELVRHAGEDRAVRLGERGPRSRVTGELVCGDETLSDAELRENRCDFGDEILAHPLDDEYHKARSPKWDKITVPFLSAANWGGQGLHPRGNFEGFMRAASKHKWLEAHGIEHWTHFYTDYGVELQKRFFGLFPQGRGQRLARQQPRVQLQVRHPIGTIRRARGERVADRAHAMDEDLSRSRDASAVRRAARSRRRAFAFDAHGRRRDIHVAAADSEQPKSPGRRQRSCSFRHRPATPICFSYCACFQPDCKEVVFQGAIDPHTPVAQGWLRASHRKLDPKLSTPYRPYHTHDEQQPLRARRNRRARHRDMADSDRRAGRLSHRAHRARPRLRIRRRHRRQAIEFQERADRVRPVLA